MPRRVAPTFESFLGSSRSASATGAVRGPAAAPREAGSVDAAEAQEKATTISTGPSIRAASVELWKATARQGGHGGPVAGLRAAYKKATGSVPATPGRGPLRRVHGVR